MGVHHADLNADRRDGENVAPVMIRRSYYAQSYHTVAAMSAAPFSHSEHRRSLPKTTNRQALAFRAGERALDGSHHGVTLLLFYKWLVARCFTDSSCVVSTREAAEQNGVDPRTIRRYGPLLEAAGLVRRSQVRRGVYRYTIALYEPAGAEVSARPVEVSAPAPEVIGCEPDPFFSGPPSGSIDPELRIDRSVSSFNGSRDHQQEGATAPLPPTAGGGDGHARKRGFFRREEPPRSETETAKLLRAVGISEQAIRELADLDTGYVRQQLDAARRCGRARDVAGFLVGALRSGGVWGSSWGDDGKVRCASCGAVVGVGRRCAACYPEAPLVQPPPVPGICASCGKFLLPEWNGDCPTCQPELFEPAGGET